MFRNETGYIVGILDRMGQNGMTLAEIIDIELKEWFGSQTFAEMVMGESYYRNRSDVQRKQNSLKNRSNTKIEHPILRKIIDQKVNYLLSNSWSINSEDEKYNEGLNDIFDDRARQVIKSWVKESIKKGIAWVQLYFDENKLKFKKLPSEQVIPEWADNEHTKLDAVIRHYPQTIYEGRNKKTVTKIEYYDKEGVKYFVKENGVVLQDVERGIEICHFRVNEKSYNWVIPPFLWLKYTEEELPLVHFIKELIDDINWQESVTADTLRDIAKFIYIIKGYDGENADQIVKDIREKLLIAVDENGGVDKIETNIQVDNVTKFLEKHRRDLYDYARSVDMQDPNLGNASGQALKFRYADLDMDCNDMEAEIQTAFETAKIFIDTYLQIIGKGDFSKVDFAVAFKRDVVINESEIIENVIKSAGHTSDKTRLSRHPWIENVDTELEKIAEEKEKAMESFGTGLFNEDFKMGSDKAVIADGGEEKAKDNK